jgi:hypothetical protein
MTLGPDGIVAQPLSTTTAIESAACLPIIVSLSLCPDVARYGALGGTLTHGSGHVPTFG